MSTLEEFEAAPVGATVTSPYLTVVKTGLTVAPWVGELRYPGGHRSMERASSESLVRARFTLDPTPAAPTTAREALDLAWELAHPVKEGQAIPKGTRVIDHSGGTVDEYIAGGDWVPRDPANFRTLDPLPEPTPDWLDAPAVMALVKGRVGDPQVFARKNKTGTQWLRDTKVYRWDELTVVTPLYPKGQEA